MNTLWNKVDIMDLDLWMVRGVKAQIWPEGKRSGQHPRFDSDLEEVIMMLGKLCVGTTKRQSEEERADVVVSNTMTAAASVEKV